MPFNDIREYIAKLNDTGDLVSIEEEVDWNLEAGAIMRRCCETEAPSPFFQRIKDYSEGYKILGNPLATYRRLAIALDLDPRTSYPELIDIYNERKTNPLKPILVSDGPCKENVHTGKEINLLKFPAPLIHEGDGGRYLGTWHVSITKDPDSDWVNWGMYRLMVHDGATLGGLMIPIQHIGLIFGKYEQRKIPMEIAIAIAPEPVTTFLATCPVPKGMSEVDIIGSFRKEPLEVIKCETVDLAVPAHSEIVIEGEVLPNVRRDEGPFGEYTGYQAGGRGPRPVIKVKAVTHRNNPILTASNMGVPVDDNDVVASVSYAAEIKAELLRAGFPITGISIPMECSITVLVVATKIPYSNIANQIASCIWGGRGLFPRIIVVEDNIDPTDMKQVLFAWATKCHPVRGESIIEMPGSPLVPFLSMEEKTNFKCSNVVYDCTWPTTWPLEQIPRLASFNSIYPKEIQERVLNKWNKYGFKTG